jgi:hypothetical protein
MRADVSRRVALCVALGGLACAPAPPPPEEPAEAPAPSPQDFNGERAAGYLDALISIGPRPPGSEGARRAHEQLVGALKELGLEVVEQRARLDRGSPGSVLETVNLFAEIPGDSPDAILLVAPYDSVPETSDGASGAALVLELGRALQARRPRYTVWLAFVEGDALARGATDASDAELLGTRALLATAASGDRLTRVRVAVYFDRVAEPELRVARDLLSNRTWREEFWAAARRLGHTATFPPDAPFESVDRGQRAFLAVGMRRAVTIAAASRAAESPRSEAEPGEGGPPRGTAEPAERRDGSTESLAVVGAVSLDALVAISERLAKIDRFVESPVAASKDSGEATDGPDAGAAP